MSGPLRMIGMLAGNMERQADMRVKYEVFFKALTGPFELVECYDASLKGLDRWINMARVFYPNRAKWKERFFKNVAAFDLRTRRAVEYLQVKQGQYDVVLQLGVLFDAGAFGPTSCNMIYTDYTSALSARRSDAGRTPFAGGDLAAWHQREMLAYQRAAHIFVRGNRVKQSLVGDYSIPAERITRIGAGVNFFTLPDPLEPGASNGNAPTILFIGHDFYRKGGDLLLNAFAQVRASIPDAQLLLVTKGPIPAHLPLAGVTVIPPVWERAAIEAFYRRANVFVLPSRLETWGDVLLEAMAFRLPCIGICGEAMEEIIVDGVTGWVVPPNDANALAEALLTLLSDRNLCRRFGLAGRERLEQRFTWEHVVRDLAQVVSKVVQQSS